jgi:hypothetical protein
MKVAFVQLTVRTTSLKERKGGILLFRVFWSAAGAEGGFEAEFLGGGQLPLCFSEAGPSRNAIPQ